MAVGRGVMKCDDSLDVAGELDVDDHGHLLTEYESWHGADQVIAVKEYADASNG